MRSTSKSPMTREIVHAGAPSSSAKLRALAPSSAATVFSARSRSATAATCGLVDAHAPILRRLLLVETARVHLLRLDQHLDAGLVGLAPRVLVLPDVLLRQLVDLCVGTFLREF